MADIEIEPTVHMRLYSMNKRHFAAIFLLFVLQSAILVIISVAGPPIKEELCLNVSDLNRSDINMQTGPFVLKTFPLTSFNQQLWMSMKHHVEKADNSKFEVSFTSTVSIQGFAEEQAAEEVRRGTGVEHSASLSCSFGSCTEIPLLHLVHLVHPYYIINVKTKGLESIQVKITNIEFKFVTYNSSFTQLQIWFKFAFLIIAFLATCSFAYSLRKFSMHNWSMEQRWMTLLLPLLILYNIMAIFLWMNNLLVIPQSTSIKANQMASWLSKQTRAVLKKLDLGKMKFPNPKPDEFENHNNDATVEYIRKYYTLKTEHFNAEFISFLLERRDFNDFRQIPFCFENLAVYFLTAKTENEKITRIKNFFEGFELFEKRRDKRSTYTETPMSLIFVQFSSCIAFIYDATRNCPQSRLKLLEEHYASVVDEPYLTIGNKCSSYLQFRNKTSQLMDQYFTISDDTPVSEPSFTLDKICYFRDFVRMIKGMDAMHTAYLIYDEIFEIKKVDSTFITNEFRPFSSTLKRLMSDFLRNPLMRGQSIWWFQYLLKKCPFLFLSYDHESHMENLIKMLKGIKISKTDEESLYFAVNNNSYAKTRYFTYPSYSAHFQGANVTDEQNSDEDSDADDQPTSN